MAVQSRWRAGSPCRLPVCRTAPGARRGAGGHMDLAIDVQQISHAYGAHRALDGLTFGVRPAQLFGLLGPNGGGKSTLFRILATLMAPDSGHARILGHDVVTEPEAVRRRLGVVFQHPSVDGKLTVEENLRHQGHLYGQSGEALRGRIAELLERF